MAKIAHRYDGLMSPCPMKSVVTLGSDMATILVDATQKLNDLPVVKSFEKLGEMTGEFGADILIFDGALKGASIVKNIAVVHAAEIIKKAEQGLAAMGEIAKAELAALAESKEILVTTAEGFEVAVNAKRADIAREAEALHSEMSSFDKAKNAAKSERQGVGASKNAIKFGPNGGYEDAGFHHFQSKGSVKSKAPKNGLEALNNSAEVLNEGGLLLANKRRIGISNNEFVVLDRTHKGITRAKYVFHGHVRKWKGLESEMKTALEKAGLTDCNGKILK